MCMYVCICMSMHVCVCVCEREKEGLEILPTHEKKFTNGSYVMALLAIERLYVCMYVCMYVGQVIIDKLPSCFG